MKNINKLPNYLKILVENYPKIASGRKNFQQHHKRVTKTIRLVKNYFKIKS